MAAPLITNTNPIQAEVNVYLNVHLTATFDQALLSASVSQNTFILYRSADYVQIPGLVSYDNSNYTVTFIPDKILDESAGYTFIIVGADDSGDSVKNVAAESLAVSVGIQFTTGTEIYEEPQVHPDSTPPDEEIAPSPTMPVLEPAVSLDFVITDTNPENRATNVGTVLPSGWGNTASPSGHVFIAEPSGASSIYVTFSQNLWPSGVAYLDWITIEASPVNGDPMLPAQVPAGYIHPPSGNVLYWSANDPSGWYQNNEILVTIAEDVVSASGTLLGQAQQFVFTTAYNPLYCSTSKIRTAIGPYIREVPDDTINRRIFENSLTAYQLANETYGQDQWAIENPSFAAKMWTCCKTQYDLINAQLLDRLGAAGQMKRLGDFSIQDQLDLSKGLKPIMDQAQSCMEFWVDRLVGKAGKAHPQMAIKGLTNSATPLIRGVRTWTSGEGARNIPASNTARQRVRKLPNIYSRWS